MNFLADDKILYGSLDKDFCVRLGTTDDGYDDGDNSSFLSADILGH